MATYCYRCTSCAAEKTSTVRADVITCTECENLTAKRDYRAENVGIGSGVRVSRTGVASDQAPLFLPTNDDFKGPGDPDGTKGMREWRDSHAPRESNKRPHWPGSVEKKVLSGFTGKEK